MPTTDTPSIIAKATGARLTIAAVYPHPGLPFPPPVAHHVDARRRRTARFAPSVTTSPPGPGPSSSQACLRPRALQAG